MIVDYPPSVFGSCPNYEASIRVQVIENDDFYPLIQLNLKLRGLIPLSETIEVPSLYLTLGESMTLLDQLTDAVELLRERTEYLNSRKF